MSDTDNIQKIDLNKIDWRGSREFFVSLSEALDKLDDKNENYDFTWVGKRKAIIEAGTPIDKTFHPDVAASKSWDATENVFIEGDNLDALKLLQESYLGKVKMIYIDPPYNTGRDFVYHDNFRASTEQYDEDTNYRDEEGNIQFKKNEKSNGRYHSDWLSMMYPRLKLARNLLANDGVIFISIDDNEQANLRQLCNDIFGEENFISQIIWKKKYSPQNDATYFSNMHDYILCFAKQKRQVKSETEGFFINLLDRNEKQDKAYSNPDNDERGPWKATDPTSNKTRSQRPNLYFSVTNPFTGQVIFPPESRVWRFSKEEYEKRRKENRIWWGENGKNKMPALKSFLNEVLAGRVPQSIWDYSEVGHTQEAKQEVLRLFENISVFDTPKPVRLMKQILQLSTKDDDIVLDFFGGSGSLAHAVIELNAEDEGRRKWIMIQLPEVIEVSSEAFNAGYRAISEIARERIRRAGTKVAAEHPDAKVDYGFRALTITDTNYKKVFKSANKYEQSTLLDMVDNIKDDRSDLDLLYGVLTQSALELNRPTKTVEIGGVATYQYDYSGEVSGLIACFAESVSEEVVKAIAALKPLTAVFRDSSFTDSQTRVNLSEHFRILSPDTKVKVI